MAYADVSDIETRLQRELTATEEANAEALLSAASAALDKLVTVDPQDTDQAELLQFVVTNMVCRMIAPDTDLFGASQASMTAGAYSQSITFNTPLGDMYISRFEKRILGITSGYIDSLEAAIDGYYGANHD